MSHFPDTALLDRLRTMTATEILQLVAQAKTGRSEPYRQWMPVPTCRDAEEWLDLFIIVASQDDDEEQQLKGGLIA